ncbi:nicotinamide riboside transporter PnuC [Alicyclobacillus fastidiosus]|uniref:nicotinamide riboside transporter PnuC n=1 Tax=Alicyclobacillus fastidiosus TaxID=392011 RepID=UPI0024E11ABC|nr:nicotinamide riboside transporter PnuC [Alicyclobacillus fastidiosus]
MSAKTRSILINILVLLILSAVAFFTASGPIKIIAAIGGIICVYLVAKESVWNYPVGLVGNSCLCYTLFHTKLYADAILQIMFMILMVFGWVFWLTGRNRDERIRPTKHISVLQTVIIGLFLIRPQSYGVTSSKHGETRRRTSMHSQQWLAYQHSIYCRVCMVK